ncbi:unnamed protein product [Rhodiola kirilowii]
MVAIDSYFNEKNSANRAMTGHEISELGTLQNLLLGSPGLVRDKEAPVDWSAQEQRVLDNGLIKFAIESPVMKYVKISGLLRGKNARDVALRCNWMKVKRRKQNQPRADKHMTMRKEEPSKKNFPLAPELNHEAYQGPFQNLLQENAELFYRINGNFSAFKLQENLDLFHHTRNNIVTLLNNLTDMRGSRSRMPPLPVFINEDLTNIVLHNLTQAKMFGFSSGQL